MKPTLTPVLAILSVLGCATSPAQETEEEPTGVEAQAEEPGPSSAGEVGGVAPRQIIAMFGAELEEGGSERELAGYRRGFGFGDTEVHHLDPRSIGFLEDEDVLGLQIAVHDPGFVGGGQP